MAVRRGKKKAPGLTFRRFFTKPGVSPYCRSPQKTGSATNIVHIVDALAGVVRPLFQYRFLVLVHSPGREKKIRLRRRTPGGKIAPCIFFARRRKTSEVVENRCARTSPRGATTV